VRRLHSLSANPRASAAAGGCSVRVTTIVNIASDMAIASEMPAYIQGHNTELNRSRAVSSLSIRFSGSTSIVESRIQPQVQKPDL
jgi:hypothetical protein